MHILVQFTSVLLTVFIHKSSDGQVWANSVDPDQMSQNAASDLGLYSLLLIWQVKAHQKGQF